MHVLMGHLRYASSISIVMVISWMIASCSVYGAVPVNNNYFKTEDPLDYYGGLCLYGTGNYTNQQGPSGSGSREYQSNLLSVFSKLKVMADSASADSDTPNTKKTTIYYDVTAGSGLDKVYGSFFCPDIQLCSICVRNSTNVLVRQCPAKAAFLIYSEYYCQVIYSNNLTLPDTDNGYPTFLQGSSSIYLRKEVLDPANFGKTVLMSLQKLINQRVASFPVAGITQDNLGELYLGLEVYTAVRCLPDVSTPGLCNHCLHQALIALQNSAYFSDGLDQLVIYRPSCRIGYSIYSFIAPNSSTSFPVPDPPPPPPPPMSASPGTLGWSLVSPLWITAMMIIL